MGLNRRDFFKALGAGSATTLAGCIPWDNNLYLTPIEKVLPYVVMPEQVTPGTPTFFATTVGFGPGAWPVVGQHRDGRTVMLGANREAPLANAVGSADLLELQRTYNPDRIKAPLKGGAEIDWDAAVSELATALKGGKVAWLGRYRSGAMVELVQSLADAGAVFWEPLGYAAEAAASEAVFGERGLPAYDLSKAHYVVSFGADFLGSWGSAGLASQYAQARDPNHGHFVARLGWVGPRYGQSGANTDDWYAAAPGSEALVALAVAKLVAEKKGYSGPLASLVSKGDPAAAASASGLTAEEIAEIAEHFAAAPAVALPGGTDGASTVATDLAVATYALNLVSGNGGVTFGVGPHYAAHIHGIDAVEKLIADINGGQVSTVIIDDVDPVYALPGSGIAEALGKANSIYASSHPTETGAACKVVLPVAGALEDWGDEEPAQGLHLVRQPTMTALEDRRSLGDVLLAAARAAGMVAPPVEPTEEEAAAAAAVVPAEGEAEAAEPTIEPLGLDYPNFMAFVKARLQRDAYPKSSALGFDRWFEQVQVAGFVDHRPPMTGGEPRGDYQFSGAAGAFSGSGDLHLLTYAHPFRHDGRYSNEPWAQEVPDPLSGAFWNTTAELSPATAAKLGVKNADEVEVKTDAGSIRAAVFVHRGVRDDVVAVAFGQGRTEGRYAKEYGASAASLIPVAKDAHGAQAWQTAKASVSATGSKGMYVSTQGSIDDFKRGIAATAFADKLAEHGDEESHHPGELTGIHHLALDSRLTDKNITDMYPIPDHPNYRFGMAVDTNACNGCGACAIACYAENNLPVVGPTHIDEGREMSWVRINRYWQGEGKHPDVHFLPMMCQQCNHAPCESVCPVLATYHTIDGLNAMVYNRCVGTRYCANNCPYKVRRFNWHTFTWPEPFNLQLNPDVVTRTMGVMEKCSFCVHRIRRTKSAYRDEGFLNKVPDTALEQLPACAEVCPSQAITFGNLVDPESKVTKLRKSGRAYEVLADLNTFPAVHYLAKANFHHDPMSHHGGGGDHGEGGGHGEATHGDASHGEGADHGEAKHDAAGNGGDAHGEKTEHKSDEHGAEGAGAHH